MEHILDRGLSGREEEAFDFFRCNDNTGSQGKKEDTGLAHLASSRQVYFEQPGPFYLGHLYG